MSFHNTKEELIRLYRENCNLSALSHDELLETFKRVHNTIHNSDNGDTSNQVTTPKDAF